MDSNARIMAGIFSITPSPIRRDYTLRRRDLLRNLYIACSGSACIYTIERNPSVIDEIDVKMKIVLRDCRVRVYSDLSTGIHFGCFLSVLCSIRGKIFHLLVRAFVESTVYANYIPIYVGRCISAVNAFF